MSSKKGGGSSSGGGVAAKHVQSILDEADSIDAQSALAPQKGAKAAAASPAAAAAPNFCALYKSTIRSALLAIISLLKLLHRGDLANAIAQAVAFLDLTCGVTSPA